VNGSLVSAKAAPHTRPDRPDRPGNGGGAIDLGPEFASFAASIRESWPTLGRSDRGSLVRSIGVAFARACGLDLIEVATTAGHQPDTPQLAATMRQASSFVRALKPPSPEH
jgi:hypothetical protein